MFLSKLGLRNLALTEKGENFLGVWIGNAGGDRVQRLRRRQIAVVVPVFGECLDLVGLAGGKIN